MSFQFLVDTSSQVVTDNCVTVDNVCASGYMTGGEFCCGFHYLTTGKISVDKSFLKVQSIELLMLYWSGMMKKNFLQDLNDC